MVSKAIHGMSHRHLQVATPFDTEPPPKKKPNNNPNLTFYYCGISLY